MKNAVSTSFSTSLAPRPPRRDARRDAFWVLLLWGVTALTFGRVVSWDFLAWDDNVHIYQNKLLDPPTPAHTLAFWTVPFRARPAPRAGQTIAPYEQLYAPLTFSLYAALCDVARLSAPVKTPTDTTTTLNPATFHAASLLVHAANVLLVFALLRQLLGSRVAAGAGALLFAVHPVQVEAIAWLTQLNTLLSTFFSLLSLLYWTKWLAARREGGHGRAFYGLASLFLALALFSKPLAVMVPFLALLLWRWQETTDSSGATNATSWRQAMIYLSWWFIAAAIIVWINQSLQPASDQALYVALWKRPFQVGDALAFYLVKLVLPLRQSIDYSRTSAFVLSHWWGYATWIFPATVALILWRARRRVPALWWGWAFFVIAALPTLGVVPYYYHWYSTVSDRYLYLAMAGAALMLGAGVRAARGAPRRVQLGLGALGTLALVGWCAQSWRDSGNWRDTRSLWEHTAAVNERSWLATNNLANYYNVAGRQNEAIAFYRRSLRLKPRDPDSNYNLGLLLDGAGRSQEAVQHFEMAAQISPRDPEIWNSLAVAYARRGDTARAEAFWRRALGLDPDYVEARVNYGIALAMRGQDADASAQWQRALQIEPANAELRYNLGIALLKQGRRAEAARQWKLSLQSDPSFEKSRLELQKLRRAPIP